MKTTIDLDDDLLRLAKQRAAAAGMPLRAFVEDALRARLLPRARGRRTFTLDLPIIEGSAPPAVDVADRNALYDLMERE
jgi:Arc/MetJ family transcription regulator